MQKLKNGVSRFLHSRIPLVLGAVVLLIIMGLLFSHAQGVNKQANQILVHRHTERLATIHHDNHQIFKYRTQLSAISDTHMLYIIHHPKLKNHPQYLQLTQNMMKTTDEDDGYINNLTLNANRNRKAMRSDRPHRLSTNILRPHKGALFDRLVELGFTLIILVFFELVLVVKIARFKYSLRNRDLEGDDD